MRRARSFVASGSPVSVYFLFVAGITMVLDAIRSRGATHLLFELILPSAD
jgi:hypothetical protein